MTTNNRIKYIDIARGIAIICIVLGHLGNDQINKVVFTFHVPIFFFITGYFINKDVSMEEFIRKKIKTLIIPYIFTCIVIILLSMIKEAILYGGDNVKNIALEWILASVYGAGDYYTEPFYIKAIGAIWFLLATLWGSIFLKTTLYLKKEIRVMTILTLFIIGYYSRKLLWFPFSIQAGCCATLFMYLGYLLQNFKNVFEKISYEFQIIFTILALIIWLSFIKNFQSFWLVHCDMGRGIIDIIGCICGCYIIILISKWIEKYARHISNILAFLGKYSLFILCIHTIELNLIPWEKIINYLVPYIISVNSILYLKILMKFIFIIPITVICSKCNFTRRLFGFLEIKVGKINLEQVKNN